MNGWYHQTRRDSVIVQRNQGCDDKQSRDSRGVGLSVAKVTGDLTDHLAAKTIAWPLLVVGDQQGA